MKSYDEMTRAVLEKAKLRKNIRKQRKRCVLLAASGLCCALLAVGINRYLRIPAELPLGQESNPTTESNDNTTALEKSEFPRMTLLTATQDSESETRMPFNLEVPYQSEIRVHNITGLTETELQQITSEEREYVRKAAGEYALDYSYSPNRRENVLVSSISLGCFKLRFEDSSQVEHIRAAVTDNGRLHIFPRVKGCSNSAYGTISIIDVDGESLRRTIMDDPNADIELIWHISVETVDRIDASPDMDLACISDKITITVSYADGREEIAVVKMHVDSDGKVSATLNEPIIMESPKVQR